MPGPLAGVTVIEIAGIGPAPFACMMLADLGARIIRIDRPVSGDGGSLDLMANDTIIDRGRCSLAVNLKDPRGKEIVLRIVEKADVLVEGFRPGVMEKLGLGPDVCRGLNPRLIYGRMTGWGQSGPLANVAGHDINYISLSGALHAMGSKNDPPFPPLNLVGDYGGGGMLLVLGIVAALFEAERSNQGQVIDAAMTDGAAVIMSMAYGLQAKGLWSKERQRNFLDGSAHFYCTYECADGKYISVGAIEPQFYRCLLEKTGIDSTNLPKQWDADRWPEAKLRLAEIFRTRSRDEWCELLEGSEACVSPVLDIDEAPHHPHNVARETFVRAKNGMQPAPAPRFSRTKSVLPSSAPIVGEHSTTILEEFGFGPAEISALTADCVVQQVNQGALASARTWGSMQ